MSKRVAWNIGILRVKRETRICAASGCNNTFECKVNSTKKYCCSGHCHKGKPAWNRGKKMKARSAEHCAKHRAGQKKRWEKSEEHVKHSAVMKVALSCPEVRVKMSVAAKFRSNRPEAIERKRIEKIKHWQNLSYKNRVIRATILGNKRKPNKPEKFLDEILQQLFPNEWKYVGDGQVIIGGKCPDFININGQKKIIELFGDYWHGEERTGIPNEQHVKEKMDLFMQYGYHTLIIWEHELKNICEVVHKIERF